MSDKATPKIGDRVTYTTTGRYPRDVGGVITNITDRGFHRGGGTWATVKTDDGTLKQSRLAPMTIVDTGALL